MSRHLFTSDLHLGHEKVADIRGHRNTVEHDMRVIASLDSAVHPDDVLWILGDVVGSGREWTRALEALSIIRCRKRLVLGNHDPAHPMNRNAFKHTGALAEVFEWWGTAARTKVCGRDVMLSHFPYHRDRGRVRFSQWRLRDEGAWLLHGHTHGEERVTVTPPIPGTEHLFEPAREVHVGWDAWHRPVVDHEVAALIDGAS